MPIASINGARAYLDHILAGYVPKPGRLTLTPMLTPKGKLYGDLTVACLAEDHFMLFGSGAMQEAHRRWFEANLPADVRYENVSDDCMASRCPARNHGRCWRALPVMM